MLKYVANKPNISLVTTLGHKFFEDFKKNPCKQSETGQIMMLSKHGTNNIKLD